MRSTRASIVLATIMAALTSAPLRGQAPDSAIFHRRQWGVDFNIGGGFVGAGLIHFGSPTGALVLNLSGSVQTATSASPAGISGSVSQLTLSLGERRYHPFAPRLFSYRTLGVEGSYAHSFMGGDTPSNSTQWTGGLFGELGGGWLVTPHLAIGAAWRLSADYGGSEQKAGLVTGKSHGFSVMLYQPRLTGQLYF